MGAPTRHHTNTDQKTNEKDDANVNTSKTTGTWVKVSHTILTDRKVVPLSDAAFRLWVNGLVYCGHHLTDGYVDEAAIMILRSDPIHARDLVDAGLWESEVGGRGWWVVNYANHQRTRAEVEHEREQARLRQQRRRQAKKDTGDVTA